MSENYIRIIPTEPTYVADSTRIERAREYLANVLPDAAKVTATITDDVGFIDQGANFERCRALIADGSSVSLGGRTRWMLPTKSR